MEKRKISLNLRTVTAALCVLVALVSVLAFFNSNPKAVIDYRNELIEQAKENIAGYNESIGYCQEKIESYNQDLNALKSDLVEYQADLDAAIIAVSTAETALVDAENALDAVCLRSYYSSWYCNYSCKQLHDAVSAKNTALTDAESRVDTCERYVEYCNADIENLEEQIADEKERIASYQNEIAELEEEINKLRGKLVGDWFVLILKVLGVILAVGGLGLLAKILFEEEENKRFLVISLGAIAASALLFFVFTALESVTWSLSPILYILTSPYAYTLLALAMLGVVLLKAPEKPVVFRTVAIVAAVLTALTSVMIGNVFAGFLFGAAMICLAFVIVPLVFTEYINIAKHIFLTIITLGIWQYVWTYHVTKNLNKVAGVEERNPRNELLLCMFLPLFYPYWLFKTAECVEAYGKAKKKDFNLEILAIAFAFVCPVFATVLIQNKINVAVGKPE